MGGQQSYYADDADLNHSNQPVVGVTWHRCNDFCTWLSASVKDMLEGCVVRLAAEKEWEAAARGRDAQRYPWGDNWIADCAATQEDQETRGQRDTVSVGCYPAGAAPCGALDLAGNVWEWTVSKWQSHSSAPKPFTDDDLVVLRGGGYSDKRNRVHCGARIKGNPEFENSLDGFRVILAPRLTH